ncbi:haloalkane dehalogenase [Nonomuraea phyllanthi]|uniref:haloalkane dehalogenase n=1 Tax=Nonomuraea phyllanthi TaxID=2219224 RepID=UPI001293347C|nr:haloalkane dehalogenase [Nonomuraea phyllanthi]QFY07850.1 haloalkane dehalogenase [Nonomuraea phyllanthi]
MPTTAVLDSHIHHIETGAGDPPVVFLHGSPTSSHLWRNVIPHVADRARVLAPDLIGMGASGKPDIAYRFADHARYLAAWIEARHLDQIVLVGHDWGGALAMDWAARHPGRVRGVALLETFLRPQMWAELPQDVIDHSKALRTPGLGERLLLEENAAIEYALPHPFAIKTGLRPEDHDVYRAPYTDPASRRPLLQWPREIPYDREPADVAERMDAYGEWLAASPEVPKLLLTVENGVGIASPEIVDWARRNIAALEIEGIGPAGHQAPEDQPHAIGQAVADWLNRHHLLSPASPGPTTV